MVNLHIFYPLFKTSLAHHRGVIFITCRYLFLETNTKIVYVILNIVRSIFRRGKTDKKGNNDRKKKISKEVIYLFILNKFKIIKIYYKIIIYNINEGIL
jgi:hypothetical protein